MNACYWKGLVECGREFPLRHWEVLAEDLANAECYIIDDYFGDEEWVDRSWGEWCTRFDQAVQSWRGWWRSHHKWGLPLPSAHRLRRLKYRRITRRVNHGPINRIVAPRLLCSTRHKQIHQ